MRIEVSDKNHATALNPPEDTSVDRISKCLVMLLLVVVDMKNKVSQLRNDRNIKTQV